MKQPTGLWATPDYISSHGEWVARFMTAIIEGCSLEEAQRGRLDEPTVPEKYEHILADSDMYDLSLEEVHGL